MRLNSVLKTGFLLVGGLGGGYYFDDYMIRKHVLRTVVSRQEGQLFSQAETNHNEINGPNAFKFYEDRLNHSESIIPNQLLEEPHRKIPWDAYIIKKFLIKDSKMCNDSNGFGPQNLLVGIIDSTMGVISRLVFFNDPTVTATLDYHLLDKLSVDKFYYAYIYVVRMNERNVWLQSSVFDKDGNVALIANSRFVHIKQCK